MVVNHVPSESRTGYHHFSIWNICHAIYHFWSSCNLQPWLTLPGPARNRHRSMTTLRSGRLGMEPATVLRASRSAPMDDGSIWFHMVLRSRPIFLQLFVTPSQHGNSNPQTVHHQWNALKIFAWFHVSNLPMRPSCVEESASPWIWWKVTDVPVLGDQSCFKKCSHSNRSNQTPLLSASHYPSQWLESTIPGFFKNGLLRKKLFLSIFGKGVDQNIRRWDDGTWAKSRLFWTWSNQGH